jgi:hypothetical protein
MTDKQYELKGLSFDKKDLDIIRLDDLGERQVCPGHIIFLSSKFDKPVLLMRAGDFVDPDFVKRYKEKGQESFYIYSVSDDDNIAEFESLWTKLKVARLESERLQARDNLLKRFADFFWYEHEDVCILDFYTACFNVFNRLSDDIIVEIRETDTTLCERGIQLAAFSTVAALAVGYTDFEVLSDVFHVAMLLDYGLVGDKYSYFITQACEKERLKPGAGLAYLQKNKRAKKDLKLFQEHPTTSHMKAFQKCYGAFYNLEMMKVLSFHHEQHDGSGFPNKVNYWGLSEIETIPILLDYSVPFAEVVYQPTTGGGILKQILDEAEDKGLYETLPVRKVYDRLTYEMSKALDEVVEDEEKELEEDILGNEEYETEDESEHEDSLDIGA